MTRKLISKLKKFEIPEQVFQDKQALVQTEYLVNYLYSIYLKNDQTDGPGDRRGSTSQSHGARNQISPSLLAQFDVYLIKKLKENNVSIQTMKQYRKKLKQI